MYIYINSYTELFCYIFIDQRAFHCFDAYIRNKTEVTAALCYIIEALVIFVKSYELLTFQIFYRQRFTVVKRMPLVDNCTVVLLKQYLLEKTVRWYASYDESRIAAAGCYEIF